MKVTFVVAAILLLLGLAMYGLGHLNDHRGYDAVVWGNATVLEFMGGGFILSCLAVFIMLYSCVRCFVCKLSSGKSHGPPSDGTEDSIHP